MTRGAAIVLVAAALMACSDHAAQPPGAVVGGGGAATTGSVGGSTGGDLCPDAVELGKCAVAQSGSDCVGAPGEVGEFVALDDGDPMALVVGPQGSTMLVFAARTTGIDPHAALVDLVLRGASGELVSRTKVRTDFASDPAGGPGLTTVGLFAVVDGLTTDVGGTAVSAEVLVEDAHHIRRCGHRSIVATP